MSTDVTMVVRHFDHDASLDELLQAAPRRQLSELLERMLGAHWALDDANGRRILGPGVPDEVTPHSANIRHEIETIGRLRASGPRQATMNVAVATLELVLAGVQRYRMASSLHLEAVRADFEALQKQHAALAESEERYRMLAMELDQRVYAQVAIIEENQRQLYVAEKLASIGTLAAGMAHEINNPIGFIRSNLAIAGRYVKRLQDAFATLCLAEGQAKAVADEYQLEELFEDFPNLVAESVAGAERVARIVANLRAYVETATESGPGDLNDAVRAAAEIVRDQLSEGVALELVLQPLPSICFDRGRMNQAIFSLLQNARQALLSLNGVVRVESSANEREIKIAVSDTGCGISESIQERIFDPFFTTRDVGEGMGLGLTVVRDVVRAHRGRIEVASKIGHGSTFSMIFPLAGPSEIPSNPRGAQ